MAVFTVGSLLAWLGPNFVWVLVGRVLEAAGTGVMWPVLQITVFSIYPLSRRGFAMGTVGMAMSVAPAIGPTLGGWQTDANGWPLDLPDHDHHWRNLAAGSHVRTA